MNAHETLLANVNAVCAAQGAEARVYENDHGEFGCSVGYVATGWNEMFCLTFRRSFGGKNPRIQIGWKSSSTNSYGTSDADQMVKYLQLSVIIGRMVALALNPINRG